MWSVHAIVPDLIEELGVGDFVEGLVAVEHNGICLAIHIDRLGPVVNAADKLSLTPGGGTDKKKW